MNPHVPWSEWLGAQWSFALTTIQSSRARRNCCTPTLLRPNFVAQSRDSIGQHTTLVFETRNKTTRWGHQHYAGYMLPDEARKDLKLQTGPTGLYLIDLCRLCVEGRSLEISQDARAQDCHHMHECQPNLPPDLGSDVSRADVNSKPAGNQTSLDNDSNLGIEIPVAAPPSASMKTIRKPL